MPRHIQFDARKSTASPRRLVLRLVMFDLSQGFFKKLAGSFDDSSLQERSPRTTRTVELPLTEERQETTGEATLDAAGIRSFRSMFLLLDDWDRALQRKNTENSPEECEIAVDTKTH
ncbi:MAG: hypothetical protein ACREDR_35980 [Blastocatellia bacterium]